MFMFNGLSTALAAGVRRTLQRVNRSSSRRNEKVEIITVHELQRGRKDAGQPRIRMTVPAPMRLEETDRCCSGLSGCRIACCAAGDR
jgi:hypothetical protein